MTEILISTRQEEKVLSVDQPYDVVEALLTASNIYWLKLSIQGKEIIISKRWIVWAMKEEE